jgi:hypothetical protein
VLRTCEASSDRHNECCGENEASDGHGVLLAAYKGTNIPLFRLERPIRAL